MNLLIESLADKYMDDWVGLLLDGFSINNCAVVFSNKDLMEDSYVAKQYATHKFFFWDICYAQYDILEFGDVIDPIDHELLKKMGPYVDEIFWMMERCVDREYNHRWNEYCRHVQAWSYVLDSLQIDAYICLSVPHEVYEYILYALCKIKGIPVLGLATTPFLGYSYFFTDIYNQLPTMHETINRLQERYEKFSIEEIVLNEGMQKVFDFYYNNKDLTPYYMLEKVNRLDQRTSSIERFMRYYKIFLRRSRFLLWGIYHIFDFRSEVYGQICVSAYGTDVYREPEILFNYYNQHAISADYSKKYIYVPLPAQPENSTSPLAGRYVDLLHMVYMLSCCLPDGYLLYVREHPAQIKQSRVYTFSSCRTVYFYQQLLKLKNVRFISFKEDTYTLIKGSCAVATPTGTAGLEAVVYNKLFFIFGYYFMQYAPNVIPIRTKKDCLAAMERMQTFTKDSETTKKEMKIFFKALENVLIEGLAYIEPSQYSLLSEHEVEQGKKNLINAYYDKMVGLFGPGVLKSA